MCAPFFKERRMKLAEPTNFYRNSGLSLDPGIAGTGRGAIEMEDMFSMEEFLAAEQTKDLVRFSTAGSVDDGKSTLIGRLLYDSQNVYEDHVRAVTKAAAGNVASAIDFAQLTDGLRAEREQGITIDVAYRYFSTTHRKFIIADTPGHEQYTRNMATGASTADVAIILVDARKGILTQSRRHAYIASLLGTRHIVAAVNKMDLVDYSAESFAALERDLQQLAAKLGIDGLLSIPISALHGDNVVDRGTKMPWYEGPTLLEYLETVPVGSDAASAPFRLPIQRVIRPDQHYRGFAGQIAAGSVWPGDRVIALPSGRTSRVKSITTFDGDLDRAVAPMSVALTLEDELDISRGEMLAAAHQAPAVAANFVAALVWMDAAPLDLGKSYLLKHTSQTVKAVIRGIQHRVNIQTLEPEQAVTLELNSIGVVEVETTRPLFLDIYADQRTTGSFILIDTESHATVAAGMVREVLSGRAAGDKQAGVVAAVAIRDPELLRQVEAALWKSGVEVVRTRTANGALLQRLFQAGVVVLIEAHGQDEFSGEVSLALPNVAPPNRDLSFEPISGLPDEPAEKLAFILRRLEGSNQ
jgi:sulfate adenylyltransferase large subunit